MIAIECHQMVKRFGELPVVNGVSLRLAAGRILALLGPSGCGKTTTLRLMAGFEQLDEGRIVIQGKTVANGRLHLPPEKRRIGMVFQDYAIFPHLSVQDNVAFGLGRGRQALERAMEMLTLVGLQGQEKKMPHELSGGQQQRVSLARALAPKPAVLLLDEPFSNLDAALRQEVRQEVRHLLKAQQITAVFVTHDQEEALFIGDEVGVMRDGQLEQVGTPETLFHRPRTRFVAQFLGQTDFLVGEVVQEGIETPLGLLSQQLGQSVGTAVSVALRPDDVALRRDEAGNGRVRERQFLGMAYLYEVQLADGTLLHSWQPHTAVFSQGEAVQVSLNRHQWLPCFVGETAVGTSDLASSEI